MKSLEEAKEDGLEFSSEVTTCKAGDDVSTVMRDLDGAPIQVLREGTTDLIGILTAYDLL